MSKTEKTPKSTQKGKNLKALQMTPEEEQKENKGPPSNSTTSTTSPANNKAPPSSSTPIATKLETDTSVTRKAPTKFKGNFPGSRKDRQTTLLNSKINPNASWAELMRVEQQNEQKTEFKIPKKKVPNLPKEESTKKVPND